MSTNIKCNSCPDLNILIRKVPDSGRTGRNVWILSCKKANFWIDSIRINNKDLHGNSMPEIKAPFDCPKRKELRKQNKESKFVLTIN